MYSNYVFVFSTQYIVGGNIMNKYCLKTFIISLSILIIIYALLLYALFAYHPDDINNWSFWLFFSLVGYFVLGLYPSIIFYYYVIYYPRHGFKVGCEPLRGTLCIILCGYYAIMFYTKKDVWYKSKIQMQTDKKSLE